MPCREATGGREFGVGEILESLRAASRLWAVEVVL